MAGGWSWESLCAMGRWESGGPNGTLVSGLSAWGRRGAIRESGCL